MPEPTTPTEAGDAWRDHVLQEVVAFLDQNRDAIIERFETGDPGAA